ncbi:calcium-binding protein [Proteus terrae]|uniref:calcium-binding protein n=2 Tax=Proteus terrae TaxID=1574161 RepID=UPI0021BA47FA|nr:RTX toxin [Proteus terrae]MCT8230963.1 RTX toxin [Proteus terrae]
MNGFKEVTFKDNINSIVLKIENHIKENRSELFFKINSIKRILTENYISIFISKNEYAANEFLEKIDNNFLLYYKNDFTKNIDFIRKEINSSIETLFFNSAKLASREPSKIQKERLKLLIQNNLSGDYYLEFENNKVFIQIDSENNDFKIINFDGYAKFFYNKNELINKIYNLISDNSNSDFLYYRFYNRKEYVSYFNNTENWKVNNKDIIREIINDIKKKKQISVNEYISIELNESYSYKNIFIIRDKLENTEKVLHIYVGDIEEAFTIAKSKYNQIIESGEHLLYKVGTGWFITKIKNNIIKKFSQYIDLLKPLERVMSRVNLITSTETNYDFSHIHNLAGLCYGLSLNYLVEVRNGGLEGGNKYLFWLKENIRSYQSEKETIVDKLDSILFSSIQEYEVLNLIKEIKNIIFSQHFQMERLNKKVQYFIFDSIKSIEYSQILESRGLKGSHVEKIVFDKNKINEYLEYIMKNNDDYYAIIGFKDHAIAISYKKYSENNYKFSLFDSNSELLEYSSIKPINEVLENKMDFYGPHEVNNEKYIIFDEYKKSEISNYQSVWDYNNTEINKGIAENIKKIGFSLPFNDNITGRIIHYNEQRDLIVELNRDNKIIEVIVKNSNVDEGIYLIKNYLSQIIKNDKASKIILNKSDNGDISIQEATFDSFQEIRKDKGYIEFNDIYYSELIKINSYLLKGNKTTLLNEITSLIDVLKGNIYFDKLVASFSLINKIENFNKENKNISIVNVLNKVKEKLENKLFYDELIYGKDNLIVLSEKNSSVAAKFYQLMINEINEGKKGISNFIYNNIIESPYLLLDKNRSAGIDGYDYTIEFKGDYQYLNEVIKGIDISELKNTLLIEDRNKLHLKENYKKLSEYKDHENINKLLVFIENKIDLKRKEHLSSYHDLYFDFFANQQFTNKMITHEIAQLEDYFLSNYREKNYDYHPNNFYLNEDDPSALLDKSLNKNKNEIDCSYLLFDDSKENFNFLFSENAIFTDKMIDNIIADNIDSFYQDDITNYFYNGIKSEELAFYLKNKPEINNFIDYCLKNRIRITVVGNSDKCFFNQDAIRQKNEVEKLHDIILENQFFNEKTIVFAKKEKLLSYQYGDFFIEGIAQRLNIPIYQVIDNRLSLSKDSVIVKPFIERKYIDKPLLANIALSDVITSVMEYNNIKPISFNEKIKEESKKLTKELYQFVSEKYPNYRNNKEFKLGYKKDIRTVIYDCSDKITVSDIFDYIKINHYDINIFQLGSIINKVDNMNVKQHRQKLKELSDKLINNDISINNAYKKYQYELSAFFNVSGKTKIENKLTQIIHDPLINKKFNQYLMGEITYQQWQSLDSLSEGALTLAEKANKTIEVVHAIYDNPTLIRKLSLFSKSLLNSFFDGNKKGILYRVLLDNISTFKSYKNLIDKLQRIIYIETNKKGLKVSSPAEALNKVSTLNILDFFDSRSNITSNKNKEIVKINDIPFDKKLLISLGAKINNKNIDSISLNTLTKWKEKLIFDPHHLNDYFFSLSGSEEDKKIISLFRTLLNNKKNKIKHLLSNDTSRIDYLMASKRLSEIIKLGSKNYDINDWSTLRKNSLNIPRHMKIISKIGYANITFGMWQSINATFMLAEQLNDPLLAAKERKEIINNLVIMWSEMAYNGLSEMIEITLAKGLLKYKHNPLEYVNKISTRISIGLNVLSIGFDIYNAYDNFSRISVGTNEKQRIDYIVNGSLAVVSGLVTLGVSIAMLAGSTVAGPVGIVAGAVIALATSIYNAARLIEEAKTKVHFIPLEELNNGFYAFLMGDLIPDKKNEIIYLETETQLEAMIDKKAISYLEEIKKQSYLSRYFYTNEKQIYQEYYYYKVVPNLMGKTLDSILNPLGEYISQRISLNINQEEAEKIASLSYHLRAEKTEYKYYLPKEAIATNETLIFDMDFYVDELKRYNLDIISDDDSPIFDNIVDGDFIRKIKTTRENSILLFGENKVMENLTKSNQDRKYYSSGWDENEDFYFNTHNGDDIIVAPSNVKNNFDIYNGTKRLSGGNKDDVFNLFTSESPLYASRFYGREGNDTLRIIKTTSKYQGYEVNLLDNYIKFTHSEEQTNSQNFHSKLFLYQENDYLYSKQLTDSMPNIVLQDQHVIAYLDSVENVIGSEVGNDVIYGNQEDNYLDGVGGADLLYGLGGNDTLVLQEGYAEGGDGNDNYLILRASLENNYNIQFETIINEKNDEQSSVVRLNYYFDEISSIYRQGKDIVFYIKVNDGNKYNESIYHLMTLRNVYSSKENNLLAHRYTLTTMDGFILTANESKTIENDVLYDFSYLDKYNNTEENLQSLYLNDNSSFLSLSYSNKTKKISLSPQLKYSGFSSGENLRFGLQGNFQDNYYFGITKNSLVTLSSGNDSYQIETFLASDKSDKINILFPDNSEKLSHHDTSHFFLSDVSGFDLVFYNNVLSHRYHPDIHLKLVFEPPHINAIWGSGMQIRFIDKDNTVFTLPTKESRQRLLVPITDLNLTITAEDDVLMIPESLTLNRETLSTYSLSHSPFYSLASQKQSNQAVDLLSIIEPMEGNDIVVNRNKNSSVINGGKGDDHIVVNHGHHILIAGEGNDNLNAGSGNDLLISEFGDDYLSGGVGHNVYIVNKRHGEVTIYDEGSSSHLFISGLSEHDKLIASQVDDDMQYKTQDNQFVLTVKRPQDEADKTVSIIEKQSVLSAQSLAAIIQEMAQFNEQELTIMQGSEFTSPSAWSPLPVVVKYWEY